MALVGADKDGQSPLGALILGIVFSWWWIAGLVAIYFSIGIISIFIRGRDDTID